ncbi:unnamed protein product [Kluyveromyces dobzhanskii CBS 2104]|uniref:Phosphatidylinositol 4-kinase n=1 Tax=Kluyveromyces dobzhanskii CBS 2104 TaxID=1427455 RepID=A0A0A8LCX4_9SACH|nr:unnamed protein product [Kluyveromyces dobzhanskii CBS 2104]
MQQPVVSSNTYEWLKYQDEPHYDRRTEYSLNTIDSIGRWSTRFWNDALSQVSHLDAENENENENGHVNSGRQGSRIRIEYSVFQPSIKCGPVPKSLDTSGEFEAVVEDCVHAIEFAHFDLQRIEAGSSGSYFVFGSEVCTVRGVFKPKDEEPYGPFSPKWTKWLHRTFFPCFFGRSCLIPNLGYVAEAAASLLDRRLQVGLVPHTEIISLSSTSFYDYRNQWFCGFKPRVQAKLGSFQLFVHGFVSADAFLTSYPLPTMYRDQLLDPSGQEFHWNADTLKQFRLQLERLIILDYIMRNTDRGLDNWMVKVTRQQPEGERTGTDTGNQKWKVQLAAIDNGLAFPWKHPDEWRSFPYGWLFLPVSILNMPFSTETREHFLPRLLSTGWWEQSLQEFTHLFATDSEFKLSLWKKQWSVLKGQAFNVVETLKDPRCGPLELVKRTPSLVIDEFVEYTSYPAQETSLTLSLAESLPKNSSPMIFDSLPQEQQHLNPNPITNSNSNSNSISNSNSNLQLTLSNETENHLLKHLQRKTVIIERLEICNSKPPLFTWW